MSIKLTQKTKKYLSVIQEAKESGNLAIFIGAGFSVISGYFGMRIAVKANVRTANEAQKGIKGALSIAFSGGAVMGLCVVGLAILGVSILSIIFD